MVDIKFHSYHDPKALAFVITPYDLDTIYIPTHTRETTTKDFEEVYGLSPEQAQKAADIYLEEVFPVVLAHESAHLALGRLAKREGQPPHGYSVGYHNPIVKKIEKVANRRALAKALEYVSSGK